MFSAVGQFVKDCWLEEWNKQSAFEKRMTLRMLPLILFVPIMMVLTFIGAPVRLTTAILVFVPIQALWTGWLDGPIVVRWWRRFRSRTSADASQENGIANG